MGCATVFTQKKDSLHFSSTVSPIQEGELPGMWATHRCGLQAVSPQAKTQKTFQAKTQEQQLVEILSKEAPQFSQQFGAKMTFGSVFVMLAFLMQLEIENRHQIQQSRGLERLFQLEEMEHIRVEYTNMAKSLKSTAIGSFCISVFGAALPIIGNAAGDSILKSLSVFPFMRGLKSDEFFQNMSKVCFSGAEMQKSYGQADQALHQGEASFFEHMAGLYNSQKDELSRKNENSSQVMNEILQLFKQIVEMEQRLAQMRHS